jgi:hypothetical protein
MTGRGRYSAAAAAILAMGIAGGTWLSGQAPVPSASDRVAQLGEALARGTRTMSRDPQMGYLTPVLDALGVPVESQLLVFSKTGVQRAYTSPRNPRALYFTESLIVGYNPGAPMLEIAAHDPDEGVAFYTIDQAAGAPVITRRTTCLACHVSSSTLDVPGLIDRSNLVGHDGELMPEPESHDVDHRTPHTERWGGWYVTANGTMAPYNPFGHLGNLTVAERPEPGPAIVSDRVFVEWSNSAPETRGYLSKESDLAALQVFNHQVHAINLLTRLTREARAAAASGQAWTDVLQSRASELADYLLFIGEAQPIPGVAPRPGFAERLAARTPKDRLGRSFGELDLNERLLKYPCSFMVYTDAFDELPAVAKAAVYRRMLMILEGKDQGRKYAGLTSARRRAVLEILRDTKRDLPRM